MSAIRVVANAIAAKSAPGQEGDRYHQQNSQREK
jgi:hypothetical protein